LAGIALPGPDVLTWRGAYGEELSVLLHDIIWRERLLLKIVAKHGVTADEVEEVLFTKPHVRLAEKGRVKGGCLTTDAVAAASPPPRVCFQRVRR
jgi:hypothetical protein